MKYKVGDKVKVINKLSKGRIDYDVYFNEEMDKYLGKTMTITKNSRFFYEFKEDNEKWYWSEDMIEALVKFTKSDLKDNHIVVNANKDKDIWENVFNYEKFNKNLEHQTNRRFDIMEVYEFDKLVWKREEQILDEVEKKYLSDVIRPFRDRVKYIKKREHCEKEWQDIVIDIKYGKGHLFFPEFEPNTMYKNMKVGKEYTLKELGLEE